MVSWGAIIFMVVLASWALYAFARPSKPREWGRAGLVQAFIISLYAEMFGFPLTLYLVSRVFGLDAAWLGQTQPLYATLLGLNPQKAQQSMVVMMLIGNVFIFIGLGLLITGWRQVYTARKENRLATDGVYGITRHPQYTGIILAIFGEGVIHWPTVISLVLFPIIVIAYYTLARKEEKEMLSQFGEQYLQYQARVPMLIPGLKPRPPKSAVRAEQRQPTRTH